jgi:glycerate 2-kinase
MLPTCSGIWNAGSRPPLPEAQVGRYARVKPVVPEDASVVRQHLVRIFRAGIDAVHGTRCVADYLEKYPLRGSVHVVAIGKAAGAMARGALQVLDGRVEGGLIVSKDGHIDPDLSRDRRFDCMETGHPLPDARSLAAGQVMRDFLEALPGDAGLLFLLSGGASSLIELLPDGVKLQELQRLTAWLLGSGLDIGAMNRIRQSVSLIKGGRLASLLRGRKAMVLLMSDVAGDDPAVIGSGPLYPVDNDMAAARDLPAWVEQLTRKIPQRPAAVHAGRVSHHVIASLDMALAAAAEQGRALGYPATIMCDRLAGDATRAGRGVVVRLRDMPTGLYLWGGETTFRLPGEPGRGGRNQHLALAAAGAMDGHAGMMLLAAGTDGTDGPTTAAGAVVDASTFSRIRASGLDPEDCLRRADSGTCLAACGDLLSTGPTGTNVTDMVIGIKYGHGIPAGQ